MKILERWFEEVWNKGREDAIDELSSPDTIGHGLTDVDGREISGREAFKSLHQRFRTAFPDIHIKVEDTVTEGDLTVARCVVTATHTGDTLGKAPTGKPVNFTGMCMVRVKDGQIVEAWNNFDFLTMNQQIE